MLRLGKRKEKDILVLPTIDKIYVMNRNHLAIFRTVAEHQGITRAAEALHISQPAVSSQLAQLESQLGVQLVHRRPRGVELTSIGEVLFSYAKRIGTLEDDAQRAVRDHLDLHRGRLAVGASTSIGSYLLPQALGDFARRHPGIELSLSISNTETIQQDLIDGILDLGLTEGFADPDHFDITIFRRDELVLIVPPAHPLSRRPTVTLTQLLEYPLLAREPGSGTRAVLERAFLQKGVDFPVSMSLGSSEALKRGVLAGLGLALVSELAVSLELSLGHLVAVPIMDLSIHRPLHLLSPRGRGLSRPAEAFREMLLEEAPQAPGPDLVG